MVIKKKPVLRISVEDQIDGPHKWEGEGCMIVVIEKDGSKKDIQRLHTGLMGEVTDHELLVMLRCLLDKMQTLIEDEDIANVDLVEHMAVMRDSMLAQAKGKTLMDGNETCQ